MGGRGCPSLSRLGQGWLPWWVRVPPSPFSPEGAGLTSQVGQSGTSYSGNGEQQPETCVLARCRHHRLPSLTPRLQPGAIARLPGFITEMRMAAVSPGRASQEKINSEEEKCHCFLGLGECRAKRHGWDRAGGHCPVGCVLVVGTAQEQGTPWGQGRSMASPWP